MIFSTYVLIWYYHFLSYCPAEAEAYGADSMAWDLQPGSAPSDPSPHARNAALQQEALDYVGVHQDRMIR